MVISHLKDSHDREKKTPFDFHGWTSLRMSLLKFILLSTVATLEPGVPGPGCRSPGRLRCDSLLEIKFLGRLRHDGLPRIGSLGRSRLDDLLGPLAWWIPEQVEA